MTFSICNFETMVQKFILFLYLFGSINHGVLVNALTATNRGTLPCRQYGGSAIYDGDDSIYILGGRQYGPCPIPALTQVLKYSLTSETLEQVGTFPTPVELGAASTDEVGNIYYFEGFVETDVGNIFKLSSENPTPVSIGTMPRPTAYVSSVSSGNDAIYIVGGYHTFDLNPHSREILKFTPSTNLIEIIGELPLGKYGVASAWFEDSIYIFGGNERGALTSSDIFRFTPSSEVVTTLPTQLPVPIAHSTAITVSDQIYVIGGAVENDGTHKMSRYDIQSGDIEELDIENFPSQVRTAPSAFVPKLNRIYVFGGEDPFEGTLDTIYGIDL